MYGIQVKPLEETKHNENRNKKQNEGFVWNLKKFFTENTTEFCNSTTLHGLKYVADRQLYPIERIFFGISVVFVMLFACYFIAQIYKKWMENPIIFGMNPKPNFVTEEPFPAVTICNMHQVMRSRIEHFPNDSMEYAKLQFLCNFEGDLAKHEHPHNEEELIGFLVNVSQPCERMVIHCVFGGFKLNCNEIFQLIVTSQGVCCVFNMLHPMYMYASRIPTVFKNFTMGDVTPVNWNAERGYPKDLPSNFFPRKTRGTGESLGFQVTLDGENDNFYCSSSYSSGFKILLHNPNETPNVQEMGVFISPGRQTKIRIRPDKIETSLNLRNVNRRYRYCLFDGEVKLQYFAHYTQRNCEMECIARVMFQYCGCITFYLPIIFNNSSICGPNKSKCVASVELRTDENMDYCLKSCLPSCSDLTYYADISIAILRNMNVETQEHNLTTKYLKRNIAVVNMYFSDFIFRSAIQTEFVGTADFISNVGGLMGLFLGFSLISVLELIYFAFLRPIQRIFKARKFKSAMKRQRSVKASTRTSENINLSRRQLKQALWAKHAVNSFRPKTSKAGGAKVFDKIQKDIMG